MTLSLAVIGCGNIARRHAKTLGSFGSRVRLSFASREALRAERYRAEFRGAHAFESYASAIASSGIDAVLITTPPAQHLELSLAALAAGKHVIVEKPAYFSSADCDRVRAAAGQAGRRVLVAENYAYKPLTRVLTRLLGDGVIGELRMVRLSALKLQRTADWRGDPAMAGGGALFEGGVHWINLLTMLGPEVVAVRGFRPGTSEPERSMVVVVRYANGAVGTLHHSWETPARLQGLSLGQIVGTSGTILFESNGLFVAVNGSKRRLLFPGFRDLKGFRAMFADFLDALATGAETRMTLAHARGDLAIIERAYQSSAQG